MDTYQLEDVKVLSATVSETAGRWYVSLQVEKEHLPHTYPFEHVVGVDVGISHLAVTSDGEVFENPRALITLQSTLTNQAEGSESKEERITE